MPISLVLIAFSIILVGAVLAFQAPVNAALSRSVGDPVWAAAIQFGIGFVLLCGLAIARGNGPGLSQLRVIPWWAFTGGLLGAIWVLAAIWSVPRLGLVTMFSAMILGQMIAAILIDSGGVMQLEIRDISPARIASVGLVLLGVVLSFS